MDCNPYHRTGLKQFCLSIVLSNNNSDNTKVIKEHNWSSQGGFIFGISWSLDWFWNISFLFPFYCLVFKEITDSTRKEQKKQKKKNTPKTCDKIKPIFILERFLRVIFFYILSGLSDLYWCSEINFYLSNISTFPYISAHPLNSQWCWSHIQN